MHGCFATLQKLLRHIDFDPRSDRLWLVGDLINRGPSSLEVLRWAVECGDAGLVGASTVLYFIMRVARRSKSVLDPSA